LGTGDGNNNSFDLDNGKVISGSYTLKYSLEGDDENDFTSLVETTDYSIEKDGGSVLLNATGLGKLGTNQLYADYTHSPKASDTLINTLIAASEKEVDRKTDENWGVVTSYTEFFDGRRNYYPSTDEPFGPDWDEPSIVQLARRNIQNITGVWFLARNVSVANLSGMIVWLLLILM